ncbi:MAG: smc, partial [Blastococcus sp.]|nr:smc [Blastococcus sp.]
MHLSSLTLKGFKSFASATTLRLEPGITAVVGPNGSGKSNVVDAIAWVLGEQGAKSLRGGKMEDVLFAGTAGRPALGRAEVTLTIDNTDGALPIEYTEVSITRRMYRSGESEYESNGDTVRLLDVQELLSDSGIGREMHVIVGQGQLDAVLSGRPEDRRAFIEEAAGVLKHRKRKEKALRKLEGMAHNLDRLADLTTELRRQLTPLGKQAEVARRAAGVQADLRDARLRLLADDLAQLRSALDRDVADETAAREKRALVERELAAASGREAELERGLAASAPRLQAASDTWYRLSALTERLRGVAQLAAERHRHLSAAAPAAAAGRDPEQLDAEADRVSVTEAELAAGLATERARLTAVVADRAELETALAEAERAWVAAARALADRREGLARLSGEVAAARSRATA